MELDALIRAVAPGEVVGARPVEILDLAYDTRRLREGTLFFCVPGARRDGHDLAAEAVAAGAVALVVERRVDVVVPQLVVESSRAAMAVAADAFFGAPTERLTVAGVTGTNGKTTTTFLLRSILEAAGRSTGLVGTVEWVVGEERRAAPHTTPESIDLQRLFREMLDAGDKSAAVEASSHGAAFGRLGRVRFDALVFTNLTQEHLDLHGDMEEYFQAKRRLFTGPTPPPAAVNVGDPYGRRLAEELRGLGGRLVTFGISDEADVRPVRLELTPASTVLDVAGLELRPRLRGRFNVENILASVATARLLGVEDEAIVRGVEHVAGVPGRFEAVDEGQLFAVVVDYAHTPEALENVLVEARSLAANRVLCVFGCGGDRDRAKRPLMGEVVSRLADRALVTSDNPRSEEPLALIEEILGGMSGDYDVEPDRAVAISRAIEEADEGDVVVIAGKGHEQGQEFADRTIPFDDREVARDALRRLGAAA